MRRAAVIDTWVGTLDEIQAYLPDNYTAAIEAAKSEPDRRSYRVVVRGEDVAGFTLDYVIDRLASGLIFAREIDPDAKVSAV